MVYFVFFLIIFYILMIMISILEFLYLKKHPEKRELWDMKYNDCYDVIESKFVIMFLFTIVNVPVAYICYHLDSIHLGIFFGLFILWYEMFFMYRKELISRLCFVILFQSITLGYLLIFFYPYINTKEELFLTLFGGMERYNPFENIFVN